MALPINIEELLNGQIVEWDRIEFKAGWNPEAIIHSICAFANDINNWGGGYIFVGIEEKDGLPQLPPKGVPADRIDKMQKDMLNLTHQIQPFYSPVSMPYVVDGKHILVIWAPGGDNRPYQAPSTLGQKAQKRYYVRRGSNTVLANASEEHLVLELSKRVPFDDRVNHHASIGDFDRGLIRQFLENVKSDLSKEAAQLSLLDLSVQMRIASGPSENLLPINAGLLFFNRRPDHFFRGAITEVVIYQDSTGKTFTEKLFTGPIDEQLVNVLGFLRSNIIEEKVVKSPSNAEAERIFNYPYAAIEEVISNAYYHRSYELENPIEINIWPDKIEALSFPGPLPPITHAMLKQRRIVARNYRNRRVGDFLKELRLTEGRATGFPTIYDSMQENGSPKPIFETDAAHGYFLAVLSIHHAFTSDRVRASAHEINILTFCLSQKKRKQILEHIQLSNHAKNYRKHIVPLINKGWLAYTAPAAPTSPRQEYVTTNKGKIQIG